MLNRLLILLQQRSSLGENDQLGAYNKLIGYRILFAIRLFFSKAAALISLIQSKSSTVPD